MDRDMKKSNGEIIDSSPIKRLKKHLTTGNLWLYILSLIKKRNKIYAYVLNKDIEEKFGFIAGKVMIYLVLYRLESEKLISSEFEERRKYYKITKKGEKILNFAKNYMEKLSKRL